MRMQILFVLSVVEIMVHERFNAPIEEQKTYFRSVKVDIIFKLYEDGIEKFVTVHEAICYYKAHAHLPWVFWRCPFENDSC